MASFAVRAFICVFNERDILGYVIQHLIEQGVQVHIIDNWSTDGSDLLAQEYPLVGFERFPKEGSSQYYSWRPLLKRVEVLAAESDADWIIHHDADEIRRSPKMSEALAEAFRRVQDKGFNAVDHLVLQYYPTDELYAGDPESHFKHFVANHMDSTMPHIKAWKNTGQPVDLASSGGHFAKFQGIRVSPEPFILKHYPIRSSIQGARKVLMERIPRYDPAETAMNWHAQYKTLAVTQKWVR